MSRTGREDFARISNVSRETLARLEAYVALLEKWNRRINLVAAGTMEQVWQRHILDCWQLAPLLASKGPKDLVLDLGSGAGLPGLVLALCGVGPVALVEADARKVAFLRQVRQALDLPVDIFNCRIEDYSGPKAEIVTARALAPLEKLLSLAKVCVKPCGYLLFLKGLRAEDELTQAWASWQFSLDQLGSCSDPKAKILRISAFEPRQAKDSG